MILKIKNLFYFILFLSLIFLIIWGVDFLFPNKRAQSEYKKIEQTSVLASAINSTPENEEKYSYFIKDTGSISKLKISALSYLIGDLNTGEIILSKKDKDVFPIASVSKLMTALVGDELKINTENKYATVSKKALATYGQNGNLRVGEKILIDDLMYPLLLESSNDGAEVMAEHFERNVFIDKMNQTAKRLELSKTSFADPSGLSPKNVSSTLDLFKLAGYIYKEKPNIFEITTKPRYVSGKHGWFSNNQFLKQSGYIGGKSGYTDEAQQTVVSMFKVPLSETGERNIAIVLLKSKDRYKDVQNILQYLNKYAYYGGEKDAEKSWVKARSELAEIYDRSYVTLLFGGDIMLDRGVESSINKNFGGDFSMLFEKLDLLKKFDIVFANLEGPASDQGKDLRNLYSFRMNPETIPALKGAGISILSVANNHVGDWGRDAYIDTLARLEENELLYTGGGLSKDKAKEPVIIEKHGIKVGFLGFSDVGPVWMRASLENAGILLASDPDFETIIKNASSQVDHLVVSFHFGDEYKTTHNQRQETLAHRAIDAGAKIVVGHHPHVIEDTEVYKNGFIAYSLGNFIFDQGFSENTMKGMLLGVKLEKDGSMSINKNTVYLNKLFQPSKVILGKEEKIKFE